MPLPNKIKKHIPLTQSKTLLPRREELLDKINKDGTFLPKSILHADLDRGFLDFVKNDLKTVVEGKTISMVDILVTTQNWSQFTETWNLQNIDKNVETPFITVVRVPEVKYGTNPAIVYNIPNRKQFFYAQVPTWDGQRHGSDVYKIPQPVPVDISFVVKIICNRMRELNEFNKNVLGKFASKQAYTSIKGHYIPIVMGNISDESVMELEKRKYYIQSYDFTVLGFLIDENEFEVSPAISRLLQVVELDNKTTKKKPKVINPELTVLFNEKNNIISQLFNYSTNLDLHKKTNIHTFDVYINSEFYGSDLSHIQINTNDVLKFIVIKNDETKEGLIIFKNHIN
jgi:hypothetical protein